MVLHPRGSNSKQIHLNSPPQEFTRQQPKEIMTKIPGQHTWLAIWPQVNPYKGKHGKTVNKTRHHCDTIALAYRRIAAETSIAAEKQSITRGGGCHSPRSCRCCDTPYPNRSGKPIAAAIAAASGAVPQFTPILTVYLRQVPGPGCWARFQRLPSRPRH